MSWRPTPAASATSGSVADGTERHHGEVHAGLDRDLRRRLRGAPAFDGVAAAREHQSHGQRGQQAPGARRETGHAAFVDRAHQCLGRRATPRRAQFQQVRHQPHHEGREVGAHAVDALRAGDDALRQHLRRRAAAEGQGAAEHFVEHQADGVEVAAAIHRFGPRLFGREVLRRADHHAAAGDAGGAGRARHAEIADVGVAGLVDQDVGRLEVAVDHAAQVRCAEPGGDLAGDARM